MLESFFAIEGMDVEVSNDTVKYSYALKERQQNKSEASPSKHITRSSARCNTIYKFGNTTVAITGNLNKTIGALSTNPDPYGFVLKRSNGENFIQTLRMAPTASHTSQYYNGSCVSYLTTQIQTFGHHL